MNTSFFIASFSVFVSACLVHESSIIGSFSFTKRLYAVSSPQIFEETFAASKRKLVWLFSIPKSYIFNLLFLSLLLFLQR